MTTVTMPKLSMNMSEGAIVEWLIDDGADVEEGDDLVVIESEKSSSVVEAPASGTLKIVVPADETAEIGDNLATIESDGPGETVSRETTEESKISPESTGETQQTESVDSTVRAPPSVRRLARERGIDIQEVAKQFDVSRISHDLIDFYSSSDSVRQGSGATIRASPASRKAARDRDIDLNSIRGSGPEGAVVRSDVVAGQPETSKDQHQRRSVEIKHQPDHGSRIRQTIAKRMQRSWRQSPHVTVDYEIEVGRTLDAMEELEADLDVDISINDLLIATSATALERHPEFNAIFEDEYRRRDHISIAIAVDTDRGLVAPVLHDVDEMSFSELAVERSSTVDQALANDLQPHQLEGGTFTVSNLGSFGVKSFTPIINPPQIAILGISAIRRVPREIGSGDFEFRDVLTASLSFDHRAVDGADAARFLQTLDELLGRPLSLGVE